MIASHANIAQFPIVSLLCFALSFPMTLFRHNCHQPMSPHNTKEKHKSKAYKLHFQVQATEQCCTRLSGNKPQDNAFTISFNVFLFPEGINWSQVETPAEPVIVSYWLSNHEDLHKRKLINVTICNSLGLAAFFAKRSEGEKLPIIMRFVIACQSIKVSFK